MAPESDSAPVRRGGRAKRPAQRYDPAEPVATKPTEKRARRAPTKSRRARASDDDAEDAEDASTDDTAESDDALSGASDEAAASDDAPDSDAAAEDAPPQQPGEQAARVIERMVQLLKRPCDPPIAAERVLRAAPVLEPEHHEWEAFAARFPYTETDDQMAAIEDVAEDLSAGRPMDRLVVGDVGFGKTEVAVRAAFAAITS